MLKRSVALVFLLSSFAFAQDAPPPRPKLLDSIGFLAGKWTVKSTNSMPDGSTETVVGKMEAKWVLGDRHLMCTQQISAMGMNIEGMLMMSYDEAKSQYVTTWFDSTSGRPFLGFGEMKGNTLTTTTDVVDFGSDMGGKMRIRMVLTKTTADAFTMEVSGGDGDQWMRFVTQEYTRIK